MGILTFSFAKLPVFLFLANFANRVRPNTSSAVGWFANTHPVGISTSADMTGSQVIADARAKILGGIAHQEVPLIVVRKRYRYRLTVDDGNVQIDAAQEALPATGSASPTRLTITEVRMPPLRGPGNWLGRPHFLIDTRQRAVELVARCPAAHVDTEKMRLTLDGLREVFARLSADRDLPISRFGRFGLG
jgi:hypothetical protein